MKVQMRALLSCAAALFSAGGVLADQVYAVVVVHRHGDRTWKGAPPTHLTSLGVSQVFDSGTFYRARYLNSTSASYIDGIHEGGYNAKEIYASCPDQELLITSSQVFLQGLYPPKAYDPPTTLPDGQIVIDHTGGMQFAIVQTIPVTDPNTIWLKADDNCPVFLDDADNYYISEDFIRTQAETQDFYSSLKDRFLAGVFQDDDIGYQQAYSIFDYLNVGYIHNNTIYSGLTKDELFRLRVLADKSESAIYANVSTATVTTIGPRTMAAKIRSQLISNVQAGGEKNKFSLLVTSYDNFLGFFAHAGLPELNNNFTGLPNYAASMVFELYSLSKHDSFPEDKELKVRFLFRNGTAQNEDLLLYPIFGSKTDMSWTTFQEKIVDIQVESSDQWCEICSANAVFCPQTKGQGSGSGAGPGDNVGWHEDREHKGLSPAVAGVVGAVVTLAVVASLIGFAVVLFGLRFARSRRMSMEAGFKGGEKLPSAIDLSKLTVPGSTPAPVQEPALTAIKL